MSEEKKKNHDSDLNISPDDLLNLDFENNKENISKISLDNVKSGKTKSIESEKNLSGDEKEKADKNSDIPEAKTLKEKKEDMPASTPLKAKITKNSSEKDQRTVSSEIKKNKTENTKKISKAESAKIDSKIKKTQSSENKKKKDKSSAVTHSTVSEISIGEVLSEARVACGYSISQVEQVTKIKSSYIKALENDDFDNLPAFVYILAYIKTLCRIYGLNDEQQKFLVKQIKNAKKRLVPDEILQNLENEKQVNVEAKNKLKILVIIMVCGAISLFLLVGILIYNKTVNDKSENKKKNPQTSQISRKQKSFSEKELRSLMIKPRLEIRQLKVPAKSEDSTK